MRKKKLEKDALFLGLVGSLRRFSGWAGEQERITDLIQDAPYLASSSDSSLLPPCATLNAGVGLPRDGRGREQGRNNPSCQTKYVHITWG
jgi:hypothetical protein